MRLCLCYFELKSSTLSGCSCAAGCGCSSSDKKRLPLLVNLGLELLEQPRVLWPHDVLEATLRPQPLDDGLFLLGVEVHLVLAVFYLVERPVTGLYRQPRHLHGHLWLVAPARDARCQNIEERGTICVESFLCLADQVAPVVRRRLGHVRNAVGRPGLRQGLALAR